MENVSQEVMSDPQIHVTEHVQTKLRMRNGRGKRFVKEIRRSQSNKLIGWSGERV